MVFGIFQNCTPAVPYGDKDHFSELVASKIFPYDVGFDQIAYVSCSEQKDIYNAGNFFTFDVAAINNLGIRVNQTFRESIDNLDDENIVAALQESQTSSGTRLQVAVRTLDNLQLMYVDQENGANGLDGYDYDNFFPAMGKEDFTSLLWHMEPGDYLREWAGAQFTDEYRFSARLQFMKSQVMEYDLRTFFNDSGVIALTFAETGKINPIGAGSFVDIVPTNPPPSGGGLTAPPTGGPSNKLSASESLSTNLATNVYGMAVQPSFKQPLTPTGGNPGSDMPPRILAEVTEVSIDDRSTQPNARQWNCPTNMYFMIVLPEHASYKDAQQKTVTVCAMRPDPLEPSATLKRLRQSLLVEDWYIDTARKCIVPKHAVTGSCYGVNSNTQETHMVNYENFATLGCGFGNVNGLCPHYASVCFRQ